MKKLSYLLFAFVVAFITSCAVTPDVQPTTVDNTLPIANGGLDISFTDATINSTGSVVAASGDNVNVSLLIKKTATGGKPRIMRVFVSDQANYRATNATPLFEIKLKNKDEQTQTIDYTVSPTSGKVYIHFDVYDNTSTSDDVKLSGANVTRKTLIVNVSTSGQIASWAGITLGAQSNNAGSRLASATGDVYKVCDLDSNMKYVDITYASNRTTDAPQLLSNPTRATQGYATVVASSNTECGGTSTAGGIETIFQVAPTGTDFDGATDATLGALNITATTQSIAVATGKVYMFQRGSGSKLRKGLIRVNTITTASNLYANGTITIDVKVQK